MTTEHIQLSAVDRDGERHELVAPTGSVLMEVLRDAELDVEAVCGGGCACATCHVWVETQWRESVGPCGEIEAALLDSSPHFDPGKSRLSCQITLSAALQNFAVRVAPED